MSEYLIDLDELVLRCKDEEARKYIAEAIACYKGGAFRAAIVTTWIAVVYDFVYKLRQLDLTGDKNAKTKLEVFENARKSKTPDQALQFEKKILDWARDEFEFLSPMQYDDLDRLLTDRNRCAHPSMISAEEIYQPPAELARYHLRNAITHLLQHPPVQGQAALERLQNDTLSEYFPTETAKAAEYFRHGPLANAKPVLVKNFAIALLKVLLIQDHADSAIKRFSAALNAIRQMYPTFTAQAFRDQFSRTVQKLPDSELYRVVEFLSFITDTWQFLGGDVKTRIENYVLNVNGSQTELVLSLAFEIPDLKMTAEKRIPSLNSLVLQFLVTSNPRPQFVQRGIELYCEAGSFNTANELATKVIIPLVHYMTAEDAKRIIEAGAENSQITHSNRFPDVMMKITNQKLVTRSDVKEILDNHSVSENIYFNAFPDENPSDSMPF